MNYPLLSLPEITYIFSHDDATLNKKIYNLQSEGCMTKTNQCNSQLRLSRKPVAKLSTDQWKVGGDNAMAFHKRGKNVKRLFPAAES